MNAAVFAATLALATGAASAPAVTLTQDGGGAFIGPGDSYEWVIALNGAFISLAGGDITSQGDVMNNGETYEAASLSLLDDSALEMTAGSVAWNIYLFDESSASIFGGEHNGFRFEMRGISEASVSDLDASLRTALFMYDDASAAIADSRFWAYRLSDRASLVATDCVQSGNPNSVFGSSSFTLSGGECAATEAGQDGSVVINDGLMRGNLEARGDAFVTMNNGTVWNSADFSENAVFIMNDGLLRRGASVRQNASVELYGGAINDGLSSTLSATSILLAGATINAPASGASSGITNTALLSNGALEINSGTLNGRFVHGTGQAAINAGGFSDDFFLISPASDAELRIRASGFTYDDDNDPMTPNVPFDFAGGTEITLDASSPEFSELVIVDGRPFDRLNGFRATFANSTVCAVDIHASRQQLGADDGWDGALVLELVPSSVDLNSDGVVDSGDLAILLAGWGGSGPADLNGDGLVDSGDLAVLLAAWG